MGAGGSMMEETAVFLLLIPVSSAPQLLRSKYVSKELVSIAVLDRYVLEVTIKVGLIEPHDRSY
jgi:hypothetical protein